MPVTHRRTRRPSDPVMTGRGHPGGVLAAVVALLLLLAPPPGLRAQEGATSMHLWAGVPLPGEDLGRVVDSGWDLGGGVEHRFTRRLALFALGGRTFLDPIAEETNGAPELRPPVEFFRGTVGLALELTQPPGRRISGNPWNVVINAGAGGGVWDLQLDEADPDFLEENSFLRGDDGDWNPVATTGFTVGPDLTEFASLYFQMQVYLIFGDTSDPDGFLGKETLWTQTGGFRLTF